MASYLTAPLGVKASLVDPSGNKGDAAGDTYASIENLLGSQFNDTLIGDSGANSIGGFTGADILSGGAGPDTLAGGAGHDTLRGGQGEDVFEFFHLLSDDSDIIEDFSPDKDKIALLARIYGLSAGALDPNAFRAGKKAKDADDRIIYDQATGKLYFDEDGDGPGAQVLLAELPNHPVLTADNFVVH